MSESDTSSEKVEGMYTSNVKESRKFQRWLQDGIAKYNVLFDLIEKDHQTTAGRKQ